MSRTSRVTFDAAWHRLRRSFAMSLPLPCWRCGQLIRPGEPWDLGHRIDRRDGGTIAQAWPEHRHRTELCEGNRSAGARLSSAVANGHHLRREW